MTKPEDEGQALVPKPEQVPEKLMRGGLIVGIESGIQGSLMAVTGAAIERLTRERSEVPPQYRLPERPIYFLDPNTRRLIMVTNREPNDRKTEDKAGLFAEIVELDEEGKPHHRLSTSGFILPNETYQLVHVGPNEDQLPPSYIEVTEAKDKEEGERKFVPWNIYLGQLQTWMNEVTVNHSETFDQFLERFRTLSQKGQEEVETKIKSTFPENKQGFSSEMLPANLIISNENEDGPLRQASLEAGLFPFLVKPEELQEVLKIEDPVVVNPTSEPLSKEEGDHRRVNYNMDQANLARLLGLNPYASPEKLGQLAVVTIDTRRVEQPKDDPIIQRLRMFISTVQDRQPIFAVVEIPFWNDEAENKKSAHGEFYSYNSKEYTGLLTKLKADLLLTRFIRGGAPLVK